MKNPNRLLISASLLLATPSAFAQSQDTDAKAQPPAQAAEASQVDAAHDQARDATPPQAATPATPPTGAATGAVPAEPAAPVASASGEKKWADLDGDGNGNLSAGEAAAMPSLSKVFAEADADKDGELTPDEYRAWFAANESKTPKAEGGTPDGTAKRDG